MQMFQLLHNAVIIGIRLLTFVSSIRQRAPRDLITLCFIMLCLNILHWKQTLQLTSMNWKHSLIDECAVWPVSRWCRYQPVESWSKQLFPSTRGTPQA